MPSTSPYKSLALALDALPNGYPATDDGVELRLLAHLFTPEEAALAARLTPETETAAELAERTGRDEKETSQLLKGMARRGLINLARKNKALGFSIMPFAVGFYENQVATIDAEFAALFEDYYHKAMGRMLAVEPQVHRVIPVNEAVRVDLEISPYDSVAAIVDQAKAWGVLDCICRKEKALVGDPCPHPIDVCMAMSPVEGAFNTASELRAVTRDEALANLRRAAEAGLVHTVSNSQDGIWYVCSCCTCSCAILRGISELGIANVVARSPYYTVVDEARCNTCENCAAACHFQALTMGMYAQINPDRCVGCGVCIITCPQEALSLRRRPEDEVRRPPATHADWGRQRLVARGLR